MKNIVICCDGTGNEYGRNNTNVVETYVLAEKDASQVAYYDPGVGTGGWEYDEESANLKALADQATGYGLQKNVEDAYCYLMSCHEAATPFISSGSAAARSRCVPWPGCSTPAACSAKTPGIWWNTPPKSTTRQATMTWHAAFTKPLADPARFISSAYGIPWSRWR